MGEDGATYTPRLKQESSGSGPREGKGDFVLLNWRTWDDPLSGGAEYFLRDLAEALCARGHSVTVIGRRYPGSEPVSRGNPTIVRVGNAISVYLAGSVRLRDIVKSRPGATVIESVNTVPFLSRLNSPRPLILVHHIAGRELFIEIPFPASLGLFLLERLGPILFSGLNVIATTAQSREELIRLGYSSGRITVIEPGIDLGTLAPPDPRSRVEHSICYVGPLKRYKGVEAILAGFGQVADRVPDSHLYVAGRGYLDRKLLARITEAGLSGRVSLLGFVSAKEKRALLEKCALFVYPSASEGGWSLSVLEAMAMGSVPIVTPTLAPMAAEDRGVVVEGSASSIARAIVDAWKEPTATEARSQRCIDWARRYTVEREIGALLELVHRVGSSEQTGLSFFSHRK
jgi:glycosyltransferase involved in cell wall biosynthesis